MRTLQSAALLTSTITTGLMAGFMFAYACSVMPGLARSSDRTVVEGMQSINRAIINGWFMLPFLGSIPLIALAMVLAWRGHGRPVLPWIIAGLALYLVAFFVTMGLNVPLNNELDKAGDPAHITDLAGVRRHFEDKWVTWNIIRTLVHTAAFGCLAWALVVYGAHRDQAPSAGEPSSTHQPSGPAATPDRS
ncbi:DUF1772 domain-containing protein [Actinomadura sp. HBU206391]|uniref:anthrone oxygenase family protein n=1 Tax=Actinomadura sp. HBU206391 TaxID=2731692 RepID=UPI00164EFDBA|nr:anthrone oxygenase family protein [Actinomadura sp. HBU206391]MBC6460137.1 DUF1772 domain-containing protein [Actinomadura sp. HBU206391]